MPRNVTDINELSKRKTVVNGQKGFLLEKNDFRVDCRDSEFFSIDNFYAFKLKDKQVINIKPQVLQALGLE